jgi:NACalpha-BTF3-like transcription factor
MTSATRAYVDRSKINMSAEEDVALWIKRLGVSKDDLEKAVEKVGNSVAAVRKQLRICK